MVVEREAQGLDEDSLEYSERDDSLIADVSGHFDIEELIRRREANAPPGAAMPDHAS